MREETRKLHPVPEERFVLVPGGVDLDRFRPVPDRHGLRRRIGVPPGLLLFTLRRLVPRMGLEDLIRAVGRLPDHPVPVHLWVGGTGPEAGRLGRLAEAEGRGRVRLLGRVGEDDVPDLYAAADIFVLPSRDLEGFGLVTLEALASGTPVIATPIGANPEVLSGLDPDLLPAGTGPEAIAERLVEAQAGRWCDLVFRMKCRLYAETRFGWDRAIDRLEDLFAACGGQAGEAVETRTRA
jgi:glycosyltransferase involved in cell wall biosynthesis